MQRAFRFLVVLSVVAFVGATDASAQQSKPPTVAKDVVALGRDLAADDAALRRAAATALGARWPDGAKAVPSLIEALDDEDAGVRVAAAGALAALGQRAVPVLSAYLDSLAPKQAGGTPPPGADALASVLKDGVLRMGPALTPRDMAGELQFAKDAGRRRAALAVLCVLEFERGGVLGQEFVTSVPPDSATVDLAASAIVIPGLRLARARRALPDRPPAEAPVSLVAALRSDARATRFVAARLIARWGRAGAVTVSGVRAALAAEKDPRVAPEIAFALGAVSAPAQVAADGLPAVIAASEELTSAFTEGLCGLATADEVVPLLEHSWAARSAAGAIAASPSTPPVAESTLRSLVRTQDGLTPSAAFALSRLRAEDGDFVRGLDERADATLNSGEPRRAIPIALAAYWLGGATADRLVRLRAVFGKFRESDLLWVVEHHCNMVGARAEPIAASFRSVVDGRERGWLDVAAAMGPFAKDLAPDLVSSAKKPADIEPLPGMAPQPIMDAATDLLFTIDRVVSLRALARIGPAAAAVLKDVDALRSDPDPRIAVLAARASRAIRRR